MKIKITATCLERYKLIISEYPFLANYGYEKVYKENDHMGREIYDEYIHLYSLEELHQISQMIAETFEIKNEYMDTLVVSYGNDGMILEIYDGYRERGW
jgi:hypothetical protein